MAGSFLDTEDTAEEDTAEEDTVGDTVEEDTVGDIEEADRVDTEVLPVAVHIRRGADIAVDCPPNSYTDCMTLALAWCCRLSGTVSVVDL